MKNQIQKVDQDSSFIYRIPDTVLPDSPYYQKVSPTTGDLRQRILNFIGPTKRPTFLKTYSKQIKIGFTFVFGTLVVLYSSNAIITFQKEKELESLLEKRKALRNKT